ncbi:hypothetical protein P5G50_15050 [Leifsonia sp. F6_8S_P_1B]|uniref:Uncharacterized protein n=1 Tax=Leifsonia williamsii TaxID=3035919 RepID=A0ABT8KE84_9MICO|nr:hypothetical protein [Leifsonia williamsii]MDN4615768.1 hypothetical protein [Leifsonia williamsii]
MVKVEGRLGARAGRAAEWLDAKLLPVFGPPPLGPYEQESPKTQTAACPLCGRGLADHTTQRDEGHAFLVCPSPATTQLQVS